MDIITTSRSISVEQLQEESNLIIYIIGLILLIVWKITTICQVHLHWIHNRLDKPIGEDIFRDGNDLTQRGTPRAKYKTTYPAFLLSV